MCLHSFLVLRVDLDILQTFCSYHLTILHRVLILLKVGVAVVKFWFRTFDWLLVQNHLLSWNTSSSLLFRFRCFFLSNYLHFFHTFCNIVQFFKKVFGFGCVQTKHELALFFDILKHILKEVLIRRVCFSSYFPLWHMHRWAKAWVHNNKSLSIAIYHEVVVTTNQFVECTTFLSCRHCWKTNLRD